MGQGSVYSIEPHPQIYQYLLENLRLNAISNVKVFNYAIGNRSGSVAFSNIRSDDQNQVLNHREGITVPIKKLDDLPIAHSKVNLLKIDVEGYEKFVIEGGYQVLANTDCIYFESCEEHFINFGYHTTSLISLLGQQGFSCFRFIDHCTITSITDNYISKTYENIIAVKDLSLLLNRTGFVCE